MSKAIQMKDKNENMYPNPHFPVGSIYLSVIDTNPTSWFGGTWEQIAQGRTLVGVDTSDTDFNAVKKTGGEKTHTLSINELPSHTHNFSRTAGNNLNYVLATNGARAAEARDAVGGYTGGNQPHNNLQPYFTCYIWCRIA